MISSFYFLVLKIRLINILYTFLIKFRNNIFKTAPVLSLENNLILNNKSPDTVTYITLQNHLNTKLFLIFSSIFIFLILMLIILHSIFYENKVYNSFKKDLPFFKKCMAVIILKFHIYINFILGNKLGLYLIFLYNMHKFYKLTSSINFTLNNNEIYYLYFSYFLFTTVLFSFNLYLYNSFYNKFVALYKHFFFVLFNLFIVMLLHYINYKTRTLNDLLANFIQDPELDFLILKNSSILFDQIIVIKLWSFDELKLYLYLLDYHNDLLLNYSTEQINLILEKNYLKFMLKDYYNNVINSNLF